MSSVVDVGQSITSRRELKNSSESKLEKEILKQSQKLLKKWVPLLGMHNWTICIFTAPSGTLGSAAGAACMVSDAHPGIKSMRIGIDYGYNWNETDGYNSFEITFVHELLHGIMIEQGIDIVKKTFNKLNRETYSEFEENFIDRVAKIMVKLIDNHAKS